MPDVRPFLPELLPLPQLIAEIGPASVVACFVFAASASLERALQRARSAFSTLAARPHIAILLVAALPILLRLSLLPWFGIPEPQVHDEFSHLLLADTLLHGRLANPPHPMAKYLQTAYILQSPTYSSKYPLGNGATLALGKILTGTPWGGVCLQVGLMCAATYWMLCGWMDGRWALLGGILTALSFGVSSEWMNTYFGGALPAAGGALVFGACARLFTEARITQGVLLGLGWAAVFFTRPYESIYLSLVIAICVSLSLRKQWGKGPERRRYLTALFAAAVLVAAAGGIALWHNRSVTGHLLLSPYQRAQQELGVPQGLIFQKVVPEPPALPKNQHDVYEWQLALRLRVGTPAGLARHAARVVLAFCLFFVGFHLLPAMFGLRGAFARPDARAAAGICLGAIVWSIPYPFFFPRYQAACLCMVMFLVVLGAKRLYGSGSGKKAGHALLAFLLTASALVAMRGPTARLLRLGSPFGDHTAREEVEQNVMRTAGRHIIFVRYSPQHDPHTEWIWNRADVDGSRVIWAQEVGSDSIQEVKRYWPDRKVWIVYPDVVPPRLEALENLR